MAKPLKILNLNHQWKPVKTATISVMDRGFLFGDAVYEVITFYKGKLFLSEAHLNRLNHSLSQINLPNPLTLHQWASLLNETIETNQANKEDGYLYIQVSRGCDEGRQHTWKNNTPTFMIMGFLKPMPTTLHKIRTLSHPDMRWQRCDIKSTSLLANILANQKAHENNASECMLFNNDQLTEGASSNIFIIKDGIVHTPSSSQNILLGITRQYIFDLCKELNLDCTESIITKERVLSADETFISSTTRIIQSVSELDQHPFPKPSPITQSLFNLFIHHIKANHHDRTTFRQN